MLKSNNNILSSYSPVILNVVKKLDAQSGRTQILRFAQDDTRQIIYSFW